VSLVVGEEWSGEERRGGEKRGEEGSGGVFAKKYPN